VFCPNCGTKNDGVELPCKKCGFKLSGAAVAPKFRGTMMLHAEQSVQELIDEHRRKQAEEGEAEAPPVAVSGSGPEGSGGTPARAAAPLFGMPGTSKAGPVQPPRAGLPKRRMGTMMGVAPQVGGVQPPEADALLPGTTPTPPEAAPPAEAAALDPLGGTVAVPVLPFPTPAAGGLLAGRTEVFEAVPAEPVPAVVPAAVEESEDARQESASAAAVAPSPALRRTEPLDSVAPKAPRRTEPLESVAPPARRTEAMDSVAPPARRRRVRPLDVFLILITFGLYGFVLLARQRRKRPDVS